MAIHHPLALLAAAISCSSAIAQTVDADAAHAIARQFFATHHTPGGPNRAPAQTAEPVLAYTAQTDGTPDLYIFNRADQTNGFVIINAAATADETSILGYSDNSNFDLETAPDALRWWLTQYQLCGPAKAPARALEPLPLGTIPNIIQTTWNQFEPYNNLVPSGPYGDNAPTGCTATAMAQIMKHYNHPENGVGSNTYTVTYDKIYPITFTANFGNAYYDWDNMLPDYTPGNYTSRQASAVATLMYHAGVAEHTIFNGNQSSADDRHAAQALIRNFRYDPSMLRAEHEFVNDADWFNILYNEISNGRPVLYSGTTTADEGHSFICDGYQNGLFHFNWGWGGLSDGYFALTGTDALRPGKQGVGGAPSGQGFTVHQTINYNIQPEHGGTPVMQVGIIGGGQLTLTANSAPLTTYTLDRTTTEDHFLHYHHSPYNYGLNAAAFEYGVMFRNVDNHTTYVAKDNDTNNLASGALSSGTYYVDDNNEPLIIDFAFPTSVIATSGTYEVLPAYRPMGQSEWHVSDYDLSLTIPHITVIGDYVAPAEPLTPDLIDGICFYDYPVIGRDNLTDATHLTLAVPLTNNTSEARPITMYGSLALDRLNLSLPINDTTLRPAGQRMSYVFDFGKNLINFTDGTSAPVTSFMTPGRTYTVSFYTDSSRTTPMNVPSITFYYDGDTTTTISDVTNIINAANQGKAPLKLIRAAADHTLNK